MDMLGYIHWRSDLSFDLVPPNEIDSLIFSTLSYETFDEVLSYHSKRTLNDLSDTFFNLYKEEDLKKRKTFTARSYELLKACAHTTRYGNIVVSNYVNEINEELNLQFSALTFEYQKKWKYVAFRGTDDTIIGWKEDFMLAYKDTIHSQTKAKQYLENILKKENPLSKTKFYVGGHSKGGHLAIYACMNQPKKYHSRILAIHNFDGPGFQNLAIDTNLLSKTTTYIPPSSFFGRLFNPQGNIRVIQSEQTGLLQHNAFNWNVDVSCFVYETSVNQGSDKALSKFNELMITYTKKEREHVIETLFSIFKELDIHTLEDIVDIDFNDVINSLKLLNDLDNDSKKVIREILGILWSITDLKKELIS